MSQADRLTVMAERIVRLGIVLNRAFLAAVVFGLLLSWPFAGWLASFLGQSNSGVDARVELSGMRLEMLIGIAAAIATDRLLAALRDILVTARAGDPFVAGNARRLQTMGWALLALQLLDVPVAALIRFYPGLGSAAPSGDVSMGGWMAVLLLFVLGRVFATGAAMRADLDGTV